MRSVILLSPTSPRFNPDDPYGDDIGEALDKTPAPSLPDPSWARRKQRREGLS